MALLDLHVLNALQAGMPAYLGSQAAFNELFPGIAPSVLSDWRDELNAATAGREAISFREGFAPNTPEGARLIAVVLLSEQMVEGYLGQSVGRLDDGRDALGFVNRENVSVVIMTTRSHLTRALHVLTRAALLRAVGSIMSVGYRDFAYGGADELSPDEMLLAEDARVFVRRLNYSADLEVTIPALTPDEATTQDPYKPFRVQYEGIVEDPDREPATGAGLPGRVTPST